MYFRCLSLLQPGGNKKGDSGVGKDFDQVRLHEALGRLPPKFIEKKTTLYLGCVQLRQRPCFTPPRKRSQTKLKISAAEAY